MPASALEIFRNELSDHDYISLLLLSLFRILLKLYKSIVSPTGHLDMIYKSLFVK